MIIVRVALDIPLPKLFDYSLPSESQIEIGHLVEVDFGKKKLIGVIVESNQTSHLDPSRIKPIRKILSQELALDSELIGVARFCSDYYHRPLGEIILSMLPPGLRRIKKREKAQKSVTPVIQTKTTFLENRALTSEQKNNINFIAAKLNSFGVFLLHGITGSGKTEIYLHLISNIISKNCQILILVPEIGLTPQLEYGFKERFPDSCIITLHSNLSESKRKENWLAAQSGRAKIILGTRLAVFTPLPKLGLIIVDEEHDASFKDQERLRYSARDVAIFRAKQRDIPIVLGSATPSLESYANALTGRYTLLRLTQRAVKGAMLPPIRYLDTRKVKLEEGLSPTLILEIERRLQRNEQSLIFLNRRGYAPILSCPSCGWISQCDHCSSHKVVHLLDQCLRCHYCGNQSPIPKACPTCGNQDICAFGRGTQRLEASLKQRFPQARVVRIDRDTMNKNKRRGDLLKEIQMGEADILVGTQILAKGHDFPRLTLVGVINADASLFNVDFRASEKLFAQLLQVAGRAGRAQMPGEVWIQTDYPTHEVYQALMQHDYDRFAKSLLEERKQAGFPPYTYQALLRAEAKTLQIALQFLNQARDLPVCEKYQVVTLYDAIPMSLTRRAGKERAQLLVQSASRKSLQNFLKEWVEELYKIKIKAIKWHVDVDPLEL